MFIRDIVFLWNYDNLLTVIIITGGDKMTLLQIIGIIGLVIVFYSVGVVTSFLWTSTLPLFGRLPMMSSPLFNFLWFFSIPLYFIMNQHRCRERHYSECKRWVLALFLSVNYSIIFRIFNYLFWFLATGRILLPFVFLTILEVVGLMIFRKENRIICSLGKSQ